MKSTMMRLEHTLVSNSGLSLDFFRLKAIVLIVIALFSGKWLLATFSGMKRVGRSRLRTLLTRETPARWAMDKVSNTGYYMV